MFTVQKMKFSITDFFGKCDQIHKWFWRGTDMPNIYEKMWWMSSNGQKCRMLMLPRNWSPGALQIVECEIQWYECTYSKSLKLFLK